MHADPQLLAKLDHWRDLPRVQQPAWPDPEALRSAVAELAASPPLVFAGEADHLKERMAAAGRGEAFVLQGGDCAESFAANTADHIRRKVMTILQMAVVLTYGASLPIVKMGRMAGQYAKPRSADTEVRDGVELPAFRGDAVNGHEFTLESRTPDPYRLLRAYHASASALNLIRAFTYGGFADLRRVHEWNKGFMRNPSYARYEVLAAEIDRAVRFMGAAGVDFDAIKTVDFYSAHEALLMDYERALTRIDSRTGLAYDCSAHFLWIGRSARRLKAPTWTSCPTCRTRIGCKLAHRHAHDVRALIDRLNPAGEEGRLTFISGCARAPWRSPPPPLEMRGPRRAGHLICDPMQRGEHHRLGSGYKTRRFTVIDEVKGFFDARIAGHQPRWPPRGAHRG